MRLCRVLGPVVATVKHRAYQGLPLLIVQPVAPGGSAQGASFLAVDRAQSGPGDVVLVMQEGNGVRQIFKAGDDFPVRSVIVGHVDQVDCPR